MDKARNNQKSMPAKQSPKNFFLQNELNQKNHSKASNKETIHVDSGDSKKFNTDVLDDAMQELLDICQQYNDKLNVNGKPTQSKDNSNNQSRSKILISDNKDKKPPTTNNSDNEQSSSNLTFKSSIMQHTEDSTASTNLTKAPSGSIERLQQRQSKLQSQLDEVLQISKTLASRQQRKLKSILEDYQDGTKAISGAGQEEDAEDEEDELVEFQQIENELRISDLNRQLDGIQEELRIRLFKRLLSNANNGCKSQQQYHQPVQQQQTSCFGSHAKNSSPSSSSCSGELTTISTSDVSHSNVNKALTGGTQLRHKQAISDQQSVGSTDELDSGEAATEHRSGDFEILGSASHIETAGTVNANNEFLSNYNIDQTNSNTASNNSSTISTTPTNNVSDLDSAIDNTREHETMTPTTSKESLGSSEKRVSPADLTNVFYNVNTPHNTRQNNNAQSCYPSIFTQINPNSPICSSNGGHRNNSVNSDLERIEEDEEDCQDQYSNSSHFRTIYEEKLSPILYRNGKLSFRQQQDDRNSASDFSHQQTAFNQTETENLYKGACLDAALSHHYYLNQQQQQQHQLIHSNQQNNSSAETSFDRLGEPSNINSFNASGYVDISTSVTRRETTTTKKTSRPLTLYLPKPDEEIDLVEHIQALGHDLNIISNDLRLNSTSAHGYLWKSCSNNNKKWLKRYFYFDRSLKVLSYYENENQLVKKHQVPKNCVRFEEISDVYVDHKLSGIGEKDRSSKRKNYVFVLATIGRKYLLASSRAETMRAWIDILFTAAKANDYFQQLDAIGDDEDDGGEEDCGNGISMRSMII